MKFANVVAIPHIETSTIFCLAVYMDKNGVLDIVKNMATNEKRNTQCAVSKRSDGIDKKLSIAHSPIGKPIMINIIGNTT